MSTLHSSLKAACMALHVEVDALFSRFDLGDVQDYGRFLQAHAAVVLPLEHSLDRAGIAEQLPDWPLRRRTVALRCDLLALQIGVPETITVPTPYSAAQRWGAAYVLEGSRLGGAVLARRLKPGLSAQYLRAQGTAPSWSVFLSALEMAMRDEDPAALHRSAQATFVLFKNAAQRFLEAPSSEPA